MNLKGYVVTEEKADDCSAREQEVVRKHQSIETGLMREHASQVADISYHS